MKKNLKYIIVALAGLSLFACNTKEDSLPQVKVPSADGYSYTVAVAGDTKASIDEDHMAWAEGDQIGWFTDKAGSSAINMEADPRTFEVSSDAALEAGSYIYAYAPYREEEQSVTAAPFSIPVRQDALMTDAMPMISLPIEVSEDLTAGASVGQAKFLNLGAVVRYNVYTTNADYAGETVKSVTFSADGYIAGDFTMDLTTVADGSIPAITGLTRNTITSTLAEATVPGATKEDGLDVYQVVAPGTWAGTVTVKTDIASYEYTVDSKEFARAVIKTFNVDLASANAVRTPHLPAFDQVPSMLTANQWELTAVLEVGWEVESSLGNKIKFNEDTSIEFDCSANGGLTFDHTWEGGLINPDAHDTGESPMWEIWVEEGKTYLGVWNGYCLVFVQEEEWGGVYEITKLNEKELVVDHTSWGQVWTLVFEAAN